MHDVGTNSGRAIYDAVQVYDAAVLCCSDSPSSQGDVVSHSIPLRHKGWR